MSRLPKSEPVRKLGQIIGFATAAIAPGEWVHDHNVTLHDFARDYHYSEDAQPLDVLPLNNGRHLKVSGGPMEKLEPEITSASSPP